ncbi:MAG: threonine--tRNA ligase [Deltaproteobacteria bacterium]|nr:threonine--tRNA ligase [Deltaproteobacteria bacterium]
MRVGATAPVEAGLSAREAIARSDRQTADRAVAARVDGRLVDLATPVADGAAVEAVLPESADGLEVLRHSTAHLLAQAVQELFPGTQVTIGPVIADGFYYDFVRAAPFTPDDLKKIEKKMKEIVSRNLAVTRHDMAKSEAIELFAAMGESYKVEILHGIPDERVSVYQQGSWKDLCRGPHVPSTGKLGAFRLTSVAGAYWRGDERNAMLQRIYGTAWATDAELKRHLELLEEAKRRDHRKLGKELDLWSFHAIAPGSPFFHPKGAFVYNALIGLVRRLYARYGYGEVITPQVCDAELWKRSGHYEHYRENLFFVEIDGRQFGVKPMNCPGHTYLFANAKRSYRDLPLRYADFSKLHRYEKSGVLHGLTRVRTFSQDDAHIFCAPEQVQEEITRVIEMAGIVHRAFAFDDIRVFLSTRPEQRMGSDAMWDQAESALRAALEANGLAFGVRPGDGAFYGPKIDFLFRDALRREWQLTTIQLDYALPERFDLTYVSAQGREERPVMIHRALFGSIERFLAILIEHTAGALPLWLAPVQARVLTLTERQRAYGAEVAAALRARSLRAELDDRNEKLGYKIRQAQLEKIPYMLVVGDREAAERRVAPRARSGEQLPPLSIDELCAKLASEAEEPIP